MREWEWERMRRVGLGGRKGKDDESSIRRRQGRRDEGNEGKGEGYDDES